MNPAVLDGHDGRFDEEIVPLSFRQVLLLDFWAGWCAPCRALLPVLEKLAAESDGQLCLVKINAEENPRLGERFAVRHLPTVLLMKDGLIVDVFYKALPEAGVRRLLQPHVENRASRGCRQGQQLLADGYITEGLEQLRRSAESAPADASVLAVLVNALLDQGEAFLAEAFMRMSTATAEVQREPAIQQLLGRCRLQQQVTGDLDECRQRFAAEPLFEHRELLVTSLMTAGAYTEAAELLLAVLEMADSYSQDHTLRARQLLIEILNILPDRAQAQRYRLRLLGRQAL
jgi:putative thioredoxin